MKPPPRSLHVSAHRFAIASFMAVYIASAISGASGYDTARDLSYAYAISHLQAFPLHGPILGGALHFGPWWFYLLALPMALTKSWLAVALFVGFLCSLQFPLAYVIGRRLIDRRFGLLWCAMLTLPGWGTFEVIGFGHTNVVRVASLLVIYATVRLAQDRRPRWLVLAVLAWMLALHGHPATLPLALPIAVVAYFALPDRAILVRWGALSLALAALALAPLVVEQIIAPTTVLQRLPDYVSNFVHLANLANVPALFYAVLVRGARVVADAFFAWAPGLPTAIWFLVVAIEALAIAGLIAAARTRRSLVVAGVGMVVITGATIALARPVTPFYMTYAMLPLLAGVGALGIHRLCELAAPRGAALAGVFVIVLLALHVGSVAGISRAIGSGRVFMSLASRLDVKDGDTMPPKAETWFPAYAVARSGALLCAQEKGVVLHGMYAYLEDTYYGLDHRLKCGAHDVRLLGAAPETATHFVGLAQPMWDVLGWRPPMTVAGMGVTTAAKIIAPAEGQAVPDGLTYPPYGISADPARARQLDVTLQGDEVLVVSFPFITWLTEPALHVTADGRPAEPLARDAVSVLYACRACAASAMVQWRIEFETVKPEWIDVVSIKPPG